MDWALRPKISLQYTFCLCVGLEYPSWYFCRHKECTGLCSNNKRRGTTLCTLLQNKGSTRHRKCIKVISRFRRQRNIGSYFSWMHSVVQLTRYPPFPDFRQEYIVPQTLTVNTPIMWLYMILQLFIWKDHIYHASSTLAKLIEYFYTHQCNYPMQVNGNDPVHVNETLT
jgi:hypothetical protein